MKEKEMVAIGEFMHQALSAPDDTDLQAKIQAQVRDFCSQYPLFSEEWSAV